MPTLEKLSVLSLSDDLVNLVKRMELQHRALHTAEGVLRACREIINNMPVEVQGKAGTSQIVTHALEQISAACCDGVNEK